MTNREWLNQQPNEVLVEIMKHVEGKITGCGKCVMGNTCEKMVAGDDTQGCYEAFSNWLKEERKWKPVKGDTCYMILCCENEIVVRDWKWTGDMNDLFLYATGLCYEDAYDAHLAKVILDEGLLRAYMDGTPLIDWSRRNKN